MNPPPLSRRHAWSKRTIVVVVTLAVILLAARAALPFFLQRGINRKLSEVPGYSGHVGRIGVHLYRGAYTLHGVEIRRQSGQVAQPFFSADLIDFSLAWGELFHGKVVSKIFIEGGTINFVHGPAEESSQLKVDRRWQDVVDAIFPIDITRLEIRHGLIHFLDTAKTPQVDVYVRDLRAVATGLQNRPAEKGVEFPGVVSLEGDSIGGGHLVINLQAEPLAAQPHFHFSLSLKNVAMPALNDFLRAYANVDVSRGEFEVFVELGAKNGRFEGYVKPFFEHMVFKAPDRKTGGPWHEIWETIVAGVVDVFKNKPQDQLAMKIPIEGDFTGTRADVWRAIVTMVHNGFIKSLPQGIEGSINAEEVAPKEGPNAITQPVQPGGGFDPMKANLKEAGRLLKHAFTAWNDKDPFRESAVIAYYAVFSLPGLLILFITLAGYFFGTDAVSGHLHSQISRAMGHDTADEILGMMKQAQSSTKSFRATTVGIMIILFGTTGVFVQLQKSLNIIWEVKAKPSKSDLWGFLKSRLFSFGLVISIAFLLLISLVVTSVLAAMGKWSETYAPGYIQFLLQASNFLVSLSIISVLFALMFKILPDAKIKWRCVWLGAFFTGALFEIGKIGLGLYFGKAEPGAGYGPAGSVILILLWVSYSSMIVFYGAELTKAYADRYQGYVAAGAHAVKAVGRES